MGQKSRQKLARRIVEGKVATVPPDEPWTPFQRAVGRDGKRQCFDGTHWFDIWKNSRYTVMTRIVKSTNTDSDCVDLVHLSIKRNDKRPVTSWRDLQKIKNELVGPECEGMQIFPAESRLVDTSNQFHLWCFKDPKIRIPFGYDERFVSEGNSCGAVQEAFEDHVRPDDIIPSDVMREKHQEYLDKTKPGEDYADALRKFAEDQE